MISRRESSRFANFTGGIVTRICDHVGRTHWDVWLVMLVFAVDICDENHFSAFRVQGEEKSPGAVFRRELGSRAATLHFGKFNLEFSIPNLPGTSCNLDHP